MNHLEKRSALILQIKALQEEVETIDEKILSELADKVKPQGSTTVEYEGRKVTVTIPMTVKWDQGLLRDIREKIRVGGDNPDEYIEIKYNVKEVAYKNWPETLQKVFIPARTITPGKKRLEVKE
jgi:hypothetical protein